MTDDPREGGTSPWQARRAHPLRVHQRSLLPQHLVGRVDWHRRPLVLMGQQELQQLVVGTLSCHVHGPPAPAIMQLRVGTMEEEEPGGVVGAGHGRKEKRRLTLTEELMKRNQNF